jgi:hypothetical protein
MSSGEFASALVGRSGWDWLLVAIGFAVGIAGFSYRGSPPRAGSIVEAEFTLTPRDAGELSCASDRQYGAYRCAFTADGTPGPVTARPIVPVVTVTRELFFAAGLFQDQALTEYLESRRSRPRRRFGAVCRVRLIERADDLKVRFGGGFAAAEPGWVADVLSCQVKASRRK